eukprot:Protomagalhaensia_sp_Gyna_25__2334@NODE_2287_length_1172_cov_172_451015_g620_i1_p2_GENE_NODE_2287_length_1172_cov_172_451015_g620_i1NODE_2287_length_1172_cov_172_451015_g620_i1_p2_ORF_typecomplete_len114_score26_19ZapB/PF06005_12/0_049Get5_bdg/PF16843_5/0_095_NODE_2287_length_1172_cov_172_451015_g620_i197438
MQQDQPPPPAPQWNDSPQSKPWTQSRLSTLGMKLAALQYKFPFNDYSANLVERLFQDLMKSVDTNKRLMIEVRTLKEKNVQIETSLRNLLIQKESKGMSSESNSYLEGRVSTR